jgi:hypothetical protein
MHRVVLSGVAAVTLLALVTGGRGESPAPGDADAARKLCDAQTAMLGAPRAPRVQLAADGESGFQGRRLLVADQGGGDAAPAVPAAHRPVSC